MTAAARGPRPTALAVLLSSQLALGACDDPIRTHPEVGAYQAATTATISKHDGPAAEEPLHEVAERLRHSATAQPLPQLPPPSAGHNIVSLVAARDDVLLALDYVTQSVYRHQRGEASWTATTSSWLRHGRILRGPTSSNANASILLGTLGPRVFAFDGIPDGPTPAWPSPTRTWELPVDVSDMCLLHDSLVVRGTTLDSPSLVTAVSLRDTTSRMLGTGYPSAVPRIRAILSNGLVACSSGHGVIVVAYFYLPLVEGYDLSGRRLWRTLLRDFTPPLFHETVTRNSAPTIARELQPRESQLLSTVALGPDMVLLQLIQLTQQPDGRLHGDTVDSYLLDAADGRGTYVGDHLPRVLSGTGDRLYGVDVLSPNAESLLEVRFDD